MPEARRPVAEDVPGIIDSIANGQSLRAACAERGIHPGHFHAMIRSDDRLWAQYTRARALRGDDQGERVVEVVDKMERGVIAPDIGRAMIDGLKWSAGRMAPKLWGDKVSHEHTGADGGPIRHMDLSKLSADELETMEKMLAKAAPIALASGSSPS